MAQDIEPLAIERGIPLDPIHQSNPLAYLADTMQIGDSVLIPCTTFDAGDADRLRGRIYVYARRIWGKGNFATSVNGTNVEGDLGVRLWAPLSELGPDYLARKGKRND